MKNKDKYDLRTLEFHWLYNPYHDRCGVSVVSRGEHITDFTGEGYSPIPVIMEWLEKEEKKITERIYKCIREIYVDGVQQGMVGECMNLRDWLIKTGDYNDYHEAFSDRSLIEYMKEYRGKILEEV